MEESWASLFTITSHVVNTREGFVLVIRRSHRHESGADAGTQLTREVVVVRTINRHTGVLPRGWSTSQTRAGTGDMGTPDRVWG